MNTLGTKFILANQFIFDPNSNTLFNKMSEDAVRLGSNESRILLMFVLHPLDVIKRDELHDFVWRQQGFEVDNSSLTQAISTLRKVLNDSTKSPEFVKTVPKRGYQFIASVEKTTATKSSIQEQYYKAVSDVENDVDSAQLSDETVPQPTDSTELYIPETINTAVTESIENKESAAHKPSVNSWSKTTIVSLVLTVLIPIVTFSSFSQKPTQFNHLTDYEGIRIGTPAYNPDLSTWLPAIKACLKKYKERRPNQPLPEQLIATGGLEDKLSLNYVFPSENAERNVTMTILANQTELSRVCQ